MRVTADRRRRRITTAIAGGVAGLLAVAALVTLIDTLRQRPASVGCTVTVGTTTFSFGLDQAENATTIAAIGRELRMPDHAVTVAMAAALQESNLHNLSYGDRDSVGLFQQRPSQGWGTTNQLMTPSYAATAFYDALQHVPNWRDLPVTVAAQRVQRSAAPDAYAKWEPQARSLAIALTGERAAAFACRYPAPHSSASPPSYAATLTRETGVTRLDAALPDAQAWTVASWLVGHASSFHITTVSLHGRRWTATSGAWRSTSTSGAAIRVEQALPSS